MKRHIPNIITSCNLICGCVAICYAFQGEAIYALLWIVLGAVFDFFDGMSARLLHVSSPIGKELDSLADDITFGVAPSTMLFFQLCVMDYPAFLEPFREVIPFAAYIMAAFSALRLAKFNLDERQTLGFIGMPTPANALFWGSLLAGMPQIFDFEWGVVTILGLMLLCSWLLVSKIPMFALKFKNWGVGNNENRLKYAFLLLSLIACIVMCDVSVIAVIIVAYVMISVCMALVTNNKK